MDCYVVLCRGSYPLLYMWILVGSRQPVGGDHTLCHASKIWHWHYVNESLPPSESAWEGIHLSSDVDASPRSVSYSLPTSLAGSFTLIIVVKSDRQGPGGGSNRKSGVVRRTKGRLLFAWWIAWKVTPAMKPYLLSRKWWIMSVPFMDV